MDTLKDDLKILTVAQLKKIISNSNIKNYSKLKKQELINLILANKSRIAKKGTKPELLKPKTKIKVGRKFPPKSQEKPKSQAKPKSQTGSYNFTSENLIQDNRRLTYIPDRPELPYSRFFASTIN